MKGPGYMSVIAGEVVHVVKCIPVKVKYRKTEECYLQLPVFRGNQSFFLCTWTHVLTKSGIQTNCNSFLPPIHLFGETWYKLLSTSVESIAPTIVKPLTKATWKYTNPSSLATSCIYSQSDLDKLQYHMFPAGKPMILNSLAREITGHPTINQGISLTNFLNEDVIYKIAESAWSRFWTIFTSFGTTSAGLYGLIILFGGIKFIADTIIHGYALHRLFGRSLHLLGVFWDSVTKLLLHLGTNWPSGPPTESHQELLTASAPQNPNETPKSWTHNTNNNSRKGHNSTNSNLCSNSEPTEELSRTHYSIQI